MNTKSLVVAAVALVIANTAVADGASVAEHAVNMFQNAQATQGAALTVDAKGPVDITQDVELPGFAFNVYDVDFTANSVTLTLVADLSKLQVTSYDDTTFDRYYFAFDTAVASASIGDASNENFKATVEVLAPGSEVTSAGAFVDGLGTDFIFDQGGIVITIGEGTDLTKVSEAGGSLVVEF